jgi:DNA-binding beta-propeller fold protein YncE
MKPPGEIYITDGYLNKRVVVYDWNTGAFKRGWGAYGKPLSEISNDGQPEVGKEGEPGAKDFKSPVHAIRISKDGLVYVGDRSGNRIQVFTKQGKFQKEFYIARNTKIRGTAGSVDFSPDPQQKYIFVADIANATVWELDRQTGRLCRESDIRGAKAAPSSCSMSRSWIPRATSTQAKSAKPAASRSSLRSRFKACA